jgi:hypothetical protein
VADVDHQPVIADVLRRPDRGQVLALLLADPGEVAGSGEPTGENCCIRPVPPL